ncbi:hypothetical protein niasHS_010769 [Heterodera schachtii]|uniref:DUF1758 domain-containing protein n=1 Tax=Heterodera schachtii TaxID=97005 RepID=A0ABD2IXP4_HETSC
MSGPIQKGITTALKALDNSKNALSLTTHPDNDLSNGDNAIRLECQLERVRQEIRAIEGQLDSLREYSNSWIELLSRLIGDEKEAGEKEYIKFDKNERIADRYDSATSKLRDLRDLEASMGANAKLFRNRADREARADQLANLQQQALIPPVMAAPMAAPTFTAPLYQFQPIQLDKFFGEKRKWPEFYESFKSAIGSQSISKAQKLNLLRNLLGGEARELIAGFRLEDANYETVLQLLKDTYGAPEEHIRSLHFELANLKQCRSLRETKDFLLQLERLTRELNNAGEDIEGPQVFLMLEKKLMPAFLRTILNKKGEDPANWTTTKFRDVLSEAVRKEVQIQEVMGEYGHQYAQPKAQVVSAAHVQASITPNQRSRRPNQPTALRDMTFIASSLDEGHRQQGYVSQQHTQQAKKQCQQMRNQVQSVKKGPPYPCIFCHGNHWHDECLNVNTLNQRISIIREKKLCFKCMKPNHRASNCARPSKCYHCKRRHPTALCRDQCKTENGINTPTTSYSEEKPNADNGKRQTAIQQQQMCNVIQSKETRALLMTTKATIFNPSRPSLSMMGTIFIDPGSHRSFISSSAAKQLDLNVLSTEECYLSSFGEREPKRYISDRVAIGILCPDKDRFIFNLNALKFLLNELPVLQLNALDNDELQQKKLSLPNESRQPDILLGMDIWHQLNVKPIEQLPSGFTICQSKIGNIISGTGRIELKQPSNVSFVLMVNNDESPQSSKAAQRQKNIQQKEKDELRRHQRNKLLSSIATLRSRRKRESAPSSSKSIVIDLSSDSDASGIEIIQNPVRDGQAKSPNEHSTAPIPTAMQRLTPTRKSSSIAKRPAFSSSKQPKGKAAHPTQTSQTNELNRKMKDLSPTASGSGVNHHCVATLARSTDSRTAIDKGSQQNCPNMSSATISKTPSKQQSSAMTIN